MPTPALLLLIATLLPLASFVLLVFLGKRMGNPLAGWIATLAIAASFGCSVVAWMGWLAGAPDHTWGAGIAPINIPYPWLPVGLGLLQSRAGFIDVGVYVDSLTVIMFLMVTLVSTVIHIFSIGYMHEDSRFPRFFTYLSLFCFSMLGLVIGGTILQLFIFWELVGLCSYLLIGFWYEKKSASNAAIKAFVVNRIGDFGFLIGLGILFYHLGNVTLPDVWRLLDNTKMTAAGLTLPGGVVMSTTLLTVMGIGLFFGAVGKSAQFPLHVWLPDAMEGPTPVSALIHAATMVAAGVYLVGRIFPILTPDARLFIAIIGCVTLTMAALIAVVQSDIKKVLAYSTLSQLGYMILAMGIGSWIGGLFHLITHAFFKALLFLGSGSVIYAAHHEQELPQYGGLWKRTPITAITFGIAVLAIAGTPFLSGYYSKDMILAHAAAFGSLAAEQGRSHWYWVFFVVPTVIAYITAFYMTRCWMLTFWGKPRNQHVYDHAHERPIMWLPLVVLAVLSIFSGKYLVKDTIANSVKEIQKTYVGFQTAWPAEVPGTKVADSEAGESQPTAPEQLTASQEAYEHGEHLVETWVFWAFVVGIGFGFLLYMNGYAIANRLMAFPPLRWVHTWLYHRMYFDELYFATFVFATLALSKLSRFIDQYIVDALVNLAAWTVKQLAFGAGAHDKYVVDGAVNGLADLTQDLGAVVRAPQTGRIRMYVTMLALAVALGLAGVMIFVLAR